jgi:hypothetical protein
VERLVDWTWGYKAYRFKDVSDDAVQSQTLRRPWPGLPTGHYFGHIRGPVASHGGYYTSERAHVAAVQRRLIELGYSVGQWGADGIFGDDTKAAVSRWQRDRYAALTTRYGAVWADDWQRLFTW